MFGNIYDVRQQQMQNIMQTGMDYANAPRGRVQVAVAGQSGGMLGAGAAEIAGLQTPEMARVGQIQGVMNKYANADKNSVSTYRSIGKDLLDIGEWDKAQEAFKIADDMDSYSRLTTTQKDLNWFLDKNKCNDLPEGPEKEACVNKTLEEMKAFKGHVDEFSKYTDKEFAQLTVEDYNKSNEAANSLRNLNRISKILKTEQFPEGKFAPTETQLRKIATFFGSPDPQVESRESLNALLRKEVGNLLATGAFGAGTGLSDADREFAASIVGAAEDLDVGSMKRIVYMMQKAYGTQIDNYEGRVAGFGEGVKKSLQTKYGDTFFKIQRPDIDYAMSPDVEKKGFDVKGLTPIGNPQKGWFNPKTGEYFDISGNSTTVDALL